MAVNTDPVFVKAPQLTTVQITVANINIDGATGTYATLFTATSSGGRVTWVRLVPIEDIATDDLVRFFIYNGTNSRLYSEVRVPRGLRGAYLEKPLPLWVPDGGFLDLTAAYQLRACTVQGYDYNAITHGYDFAA
jgi:hypothetical protein